MERSREDVKDLRDERGAAFITATGITMIGVLVGLMAFFVAFAPGS
jgi:hypothetical protein